MTSLNLIGKNTEECQIRKYFLSFFSFFHMSPQTCFYNWIWIRGLGRKSGGKYALNFNDTSYYVGGFLYAIAKVMGFTLTATLQSHYSTETTIQIFI